jgi:hypothetical protein
MRPQEALWAAPALASVAIHAWRDRRWSLAATRLALLALGFAALYWMQLVVYQKLYGAMLVVPQGKLYVQLAHAHPWLALFSARSGWLYWTPLMWLPMIGTVAFARRGGGLGVAIVLTMIANFYVASAALAWTGSGTSGARVQTSLAAGLVVCAAASIAAILRWTARRRFAAAAALGLGLAPLLLVTWFVPTSGAAIDRPVPAPDLYGEAVRQPLRKLYAKTGNPCIFPASIAFKLRYRAPVVAFDALADDGMFKRHYRTLKTEDDILDFRESARPSAFWSEGLPPSPVFGADVKPNARFLVTLYWPWVTRLRVRARPTTAEPGKLRIHTGSLFGAELVGEATFSGDEEVEVAVPRGAFDSGINEVILDSHPPVALVTMRFVDEGAHDTGIRVLE